MAFTVEFDSASAPQFVKGGIIETSQEDWSWIPGRYNSRPQRQYQRTPTASQPAKLGPYALSTFSDGEEQEHEDDDVPGQEPQPRNDLSGTTLVNPRGVFKTSKRMVSGVSCRLTM